MDIMVDIETMSTKTHAAVASIGAIAFEPNEVDTFESIMGEPIEKVHDPLWRPERSCVWPPSDKPVTRFFYIKFDLRTQRGRHFDADTIYWWFQQEEKARLDLIVNQYETKTALKAFAAWCNTWAYLKTERAWAFGATFDHPILESLFQDNGMLYPFGFRRQLCMRTIVDHAQLSPPEMSNGIVGHNALHDAIRQTIWIQHCFRKLKGR